MTDAELLKRPGFDLDTAVLLAEASSVAYQSDVAVRGFTQARGFSRVAFFDNDNVQGYWCIGDDVALLVFRGTSNPGQWLRDVQILPVPHPWGLVHAGFLSGVGAVENALRELDAAASGKHVWVTGHSLGGALAVIAAARFKINKICEPLLHTYGQPAVGLDGFAERFAIELPGRLWRFVNQSDIVTRVPPGFRHTGIVKRIVRPGVLETLAVLEARAKAEAAPLVPPELGQAEVLESIIVGGSALESANSLRSANVDRPLFIEIDPRPLSELEFKQLQVALGAATTSEFRQPALESAIPWFSDHAILEYIRLLTEIRDAPPA
jgi:hypothetical protein